MKSLYRFFNIVIYLSIIIIAIISTYNFYYNDKKLSGIVMCFCLFLLGLSGVNDNIYEYKQAKNENNIQKSNSRLFRLTRALGLVIAGFFGVFSLIIRWKNLL